MATRGITHGGNQCSSLDTLARLTCTHHEHVPAWVCMYVQGAEYDAFKAVAQKIEDVVFVDTKSKDVAAVAGLKSHGIAMIKNFKGE